jgi:hypothetical protein
LWKKNDKTDPVRYDGSYSSEGFKAFLKKNSKAYRKHLGLEVEEEETKKDEPIIENKEL